MNAAVSKSGSAPQALHPRERLIVALDLPDVAAAEAMVARIGDAASFYKIGYQLGYAGGLGFAQRLIAEGRQVFLDLKLHDIGNTVAHGVESIAKLGATFLTVHAYPQTMRAALTGRGSAPLRLLAVTVLTSYNEADLAEAGYAGSIAALVEKRAAQARDIGLDGIVCAPDEAEPLRRLVGPAMALVTPGVRPTGSDAGDQKRFTTPARAIAAGADHIVVGRPITGAADPRAAAAAIVAEITAAAS